MQIYLTSEQEREADVNAVNFGLSSEMLMNRAGRAIADEVQAAARRLNANKVVVVCEIGRASCRERVLAGV